MLLCTLLCVAIGVCLVSSTTLLMTVTAACWEMGTATPSATTMMFKMERIGNPRTFQARIIGNNQCDQDTFGYDTGTVMSLREDCMIGNGYCY